MLFKSHESGCSVLLRGEEGGREYWTNVPLGMIQSDDVVFHIMDPPEIPDQDRSDGAQKHAISRHEVQKPARGRQDLPGHHDPCDQGADKLPAPNVDVRREERCQIIGSR